VKNGIGYEAFSTTEIEICFVVLNGHLMLWKEFSIEEINDKFKKPILVLGKNRLESFV